MWDLKLKCKNKAYLEWSIFKAYLVDEMATFYSFYFEDGAHTSLPRPPIVDMGNLRGTMGCLPIFSHPGINVEKYNEYQRIKQIEFHIVHTYVV